ncbi:MAG: NUDIX domain-containing protein [Gammaproteobacteria bacterium]
MKKFEILEQTVCHDGFFRIERYKLRHQLFSGGWSDVLIRELFERGHAAAVLPYDPVRDEVVLIEQFRVGAMEDGRGAWLLEVVAGVIEEGETPNDVACREAIEEAGSTITGLIPVCDYLVSPGGTSERIALFCGKVDTKNVGGIHGLANEGEDIKVSVMSFYDALSLLKSGKIYSASPIIALQWLALNRDNVRKQWLDVNS